MKLTVDMPDGSCAVLDAREGWTVMEAIRDAGLPIIAQCGGGRACATCHIQVDAEVFPMLSAMDDEEAELLEASDSFVPGRSRLGCQVICEEKLEALTVQLQPDSAET